MDTEWSLNVCSEGEGDISNESQDHGLGDQVDNGLTSQARKYRLNRPSGRKVLTMFRIFREVPINFLVGTMSGHLSSRIVGVH